MRIKVQSGMGIADCSRSESFEANGDSSYSTGGRPVSRYGVISQMAGPVSSIPQTLQMLADADFGLIRQCFSDIGFSARHLLEKLGIRNAKEVYRFGVRAELGEDLLGYILRLFVSEESVRRDRLMKAGLPPAVWSAFERAHLICTFQHAPEYCTALVRLQPVGSLILASDRHIRIDAFPTVERLDAVYDPLEETTREYLRFMPRKTCRRFLELCSGTGVAALRAATSFASQSWASDVSQRSVDFAKFNAKLNGIDNVTIALSDLFDSLEDMQFDYIVAHPPYMPSLGDATVYRSGGEVGDELLINILRALPEHLAVGGFFYARATVTDREGLSFERQVRMELGKHSNAFDVLVLALRESFPSEFCLDMKKNRKYSPTQSSKQLSIYRANGVVRLVSCVFLIHRHSDDRESFTARYPIVDPGRLVYLFKRESAALMSPTGQSSSPDSYSCLGPK